ncbi:MAG: hypothetical protein HY983_00200 [Candidatus Magasanikbacteria bacterium]|nr:hypothetical protein [Candidatus Magasanikbacteria bacterium]
MVLFLQMLLVIYLFYMGEKGEKPGTGNSNVEVDPALFEGQSGQPTAPRKPEVLARITLERGVRKPEFNEAKTVAISPAEIQREIAAKKEIAASMNVAQRVAGRVAGFYPAVSPRPEELGRGDLGRKVVVASPGEAAKAAGQARKTAETDRQREMEKFLEIARAISVPEQVESGKALEEVVDRLNRGVFGLKPEEISRRLKESEGHAMRIDLNPPVVTDIRVGARYYTLVITDLAGDYFAPDAPRYYIRAGKEIEPVHPEPEKLEKKGTGFLARVKKLFGGGE